MGELTIAIDVLAAWFRPFRAFLPVDSESHRAVHVFNSAISGLDNQCFSKATKLRPVV